MMTHSNKRLRWFREQSLLEQFVVCFNGSGSCLHSQDKTYDTTVSDATYGNTLQTTTRLTANDAIINITSSRNAAMTHYSANNLNQYSSVSTDAFTYDLDGNLITNGTHACEYDAENRLILVASLVVTNGSKRVRNQYDYKHRRIGKVVESYYDGIWQTSESHTFIYDGWNVIAEYISYANGTSKTIEYFWGDDLSNSAQGAGGIGGLLAISINGAYYFPAYDFNGNVTAYISESGNIAAWYAYDGFGNTIDSYGDSSSFSFCFSTKYHDTETGMYYYGHRFYLPHLGRWLNSDPIEEDGGENLYVFCGNNSIVYVDYLGMYRFDSIADFCAGVADSLTMGLTQGVRRAMNRAMFDDWDDFNVDYTSSAYIAGEITETSVEIAVTVGGSVLKKAAAKTLRNSAEYGARRNFRKVNNLVGGEIHHVNPIKGHPGGKLARYPLPFDFAVRGAWNMKWYPSRAAHFAAHKHMEKIEKIDEFRECTLLIRQAGNSIVQMLDSVVGEKCWQSVDISASAENLVSISNGE